MANISLPPTFFSCLSSGTMIFFFFYDLKSKTKIASFRIIWFDNIFFPKFTFNFQSRFYELIDNSNFNNFLFITGIKSMRLNRFLSPGLQDAFGLKCVKANANLSASIIYLNHYHYWGIFFKKKFGLKRH